MWLFAAFCVFAAIVAFACGIGWLLSKSVWARSLERGADWLFWLSHPGAMVESLADRLVRSSGEGVGVDRLVGASAKVLSTPPERLRIQVNGEVWQARADSSLAVGQSVRIAAVEGLVLHVEAAEDAA
ncbi:MAG: NfeD family protein [Proteobacteria bacterium]|nr:NfeD family protein [Pseudomonadota bacterium]